MISNRIGLILSPSLFIKNIAKEWSEYKGDKSLGHVWLCLVRYHLKGGMEGGFYKIMTTRKEALGKKEGPKADRG